MSLLQNSNAIQTAGGYDINNSLRFRSSASAYLNRTPASASSTTTWTISFWIKLSDLASSVDIFSAGGAGTETELRYGYNTLGSFSFSVNGTTTFVSTTALRRDPSSWYHIVVVANTTSATSTERFKLYVNNELQTFTTATQPAQNTSMGWNSNVLHYIGRRVGATSYFDGYIAEFHSIDGQALTPSSFGATDAVTGVWAPKAYTGTYGTNGFYLKFSDIATTSGSNAGLGKDFSGNGNYWNTNNISVTAGTTYDAMTDSPTLTSATVGNYAVVNPIFTRTPNVTISYANLRISTSAAADSYFSGTMGTGTSGKYYYEMTYTSAGNAILVGVQSNPTTGNANGGTYRSNTGTIYNLDGTTATTGATFTTGDIIGVAINVDSGSVTFYKNNVSQGSFSFTAGTEMFMFGRTNGTGSETADFNFGQRPFAYTPPTGYKALNTYNLPNSTIVKANSYMDATLYTGTGATLSITNAGAFRPDLVWMKQRSTATNKHALYDAVRGIQNEIDTSSSSSQSSTLQGLTAFNSNGFTIGSDTTSNTNGKTYVGWQWQAGSSTVTNTTGTISTQVRASTTTGFSIATFVGTGVNGTIGHGLGVAPKMVVVKKYAGAGSAWTIWHTSLANTQYIPGFSTGAAVTNATVWNSTSPTSTVISLGTNALVNRSGDSYLAYSWAEIDGFSKFGSYTGNGSTDGTFVYTGFRPKFILFRNSTSGTDDWAMYDTSRDSYNLAKNYLSPGTNGAEDPGKGTLDFLSNGFKLRNNNPGINGSSSTYIYAAFAENPFKNSLAR